MIWEQYFLGCLEKSHFPVSSYVLLGVLYFTLKGLLNYGISHNNSLSLKSLMVEF